MGSIKKPKPIVTVKPRDPKTPAEWREAVNAAEMLLRVDSARQYGLITGGPEVKHARAVELLERGAALGYKPAPLAELIALYL